MKKLIMLLITTVLAFAVVGCGAKKGEMIPLPQNDEKSESDEPEKEYLTGKHSVVI
jgi:hypothetical protein